MGAVGGDIIPLAMGIAISPVPVIAAILMLLSPKARTTGVGFLLGWVIGIVVVVGVFTLLSSALPGADDTGSAPVRALIQLVLGVLLLLLALKQWRGPPKDGQSSSRPKWMQVIDTISAPAALGLGFLLSAANPKDLLRVRRLDPPP